MKAKVLKSSPLGQAFTAFFEKVKAANAARKALKEKHGWGETISSTFDMGGGISGVGFSEKPHGWRNAGRCLGRMYYWPMSSLKANAAVLAELADLPKVP